MDEKDTSAEKDKNDQEVIEGKTEETKGTVKEALRKVMESEREKRQQMKPEKKSEDVHEMGPDNQWLLRALLDNMGRVAVPSEFRVLLADSACSCEGVCTMRPLAT
eukprot:gnl/TRDRNA2_/TRDRNA2_157778_c0_seq4.p2 gnl/TRDRNA2_/TRDRNA2_157778_c0~~gnl/TRDRNA2_/TRDRNA2_157778_c0_seq4.p2  ORF type:complete len:106 (-),score=36.32 gnl/TRDRNA2_/TRDRNA2_157778_c0_seq4:183-500(-)